MKRFLAALRFLTILPVPGTWGTAEEDLARSVPFFPIIGLLVGAAVAALAWGLAQVAPPLVAAAVLVIALVGCSGGLHLDGLSDTADGLLSSRTRERMLEIMKDSHVGAMGVLAIVGVVLVKFAALASVPRERLWPVALLMPLAGRAAICVHMALLPYLRENGLAGVFYRRSLWPSAVVAMALLATVSWLLLDTAGLIVWAASLAATLLLAAYGYRKIGGATGDTLGAVCEIVEAVPALTVAVWPVDLLR